MEVRVLGPLVAEASGTSFVPSASKPKAVLALLLLNVNHVVPVFTLQKELWGDKPPRSALTTLQTYILQLRRLLCEALSSSDDLTAKDILVTKSTGYMFRMDADILDAHYFQRLNKMGQEAFAEGNYPLASQAFHSALSAWNGPALVDVQVGSVLEGHVIRLEDARMNALEYRIETDLRLGRYLEVVGDLRALSIEHPFNENLGAQYMTALHHVGRRADALAVYQKLRHRLVDELGLEPAPVLQRLQQTILSGEPILTPSSYPRGMGSLLAA